MRSRSPPRTLFRRRSAAPTDGVCHDQPTQSAPDLLLSALGPAVDHLRLAGGLLSALRVGLDDHRENPSHFLPLLAPAASGPRAQCRGLPAGRAVRRGPAAAAARGTVAVLKGTLLLSLLVMAT